MFRMAIGSGPGRLADSRANRREEHSRRAAHSRRQAIARIACVVATALLGCNSGGGSDGGSTADESVEPLTTMERSSRFLAQATLGASMEEVERVEALGFESWIDEQLGQPYSSHLDELERLQSRYAIAGDQIAYASPTFRRFAWWNEVMTSPDVLRQRVALALSEILVVSELSDALFIDPRSVASYYDLLLTHAFGSYEELLLAVTLHPAMGSYLSHLNNDRSNLAIGRFPDENYAREAMQLFSIGLFELLPDGTQVLDSDGEPIPTYDNEDITEFAKVYTGLGLQGPFARFGGPFGDRALPMIMYEDHHEAGAKTLLDGFILPGGQTGMQDIEDAIGHLADHPNVGPFLATRLIQRLVRSNPTPAYIERVADVFDDDGSGARGNLGAVVRAILLDDEARRDPSDETDGFLREPFLRWVTLLRAFDASAASGEYLVDGGIPGFLLQQHPMASPSVFNFFQPDFAPNGPIKDAGLKAPEFQITTDSSVIWLANLAFVFVVSEPAIPADESLFAPGSIAPEDIPLALDLSDETDLVDDVEALVDRLDLLLTYGTLSESTRTLITDALEDTDPAARAVLALNLFLSSPDYAIVD
jgi:uncharacterized protein (DUF1800 family)